MLLADQLHIYKIKPWRNRFTNQTVSRQSICKLRSFSRRPPGHVNSRHCSARFIIAHHTVFNVPSGKSACTELHLPLGIKCTMSDWFKWPSANSSSAS